MKDSSEFEQDLTSSERERLLKVMGELQNQQPPTESPNFVAAVMASLPTGSRRQLTLVQHLSEYFQPHAWLFAAAMLLGVFSLSSRSLWNPPANVSTRELLLSEVSDRQLFETLADNGNSDLFVVNSYKGEGI